MLDRSWLFWLLPLLIAAGSPLSAPVAAPRNATLPMVSPDGRHIAYISEHNGIGNLFIVNIEGNDSYRVTPLTQDAHSPDWSADSQSVVYSVSEGDTVHLWSIVLPTRDSREIWYPIRQSICAVRGTSARLSHDARRVVYARGSWTRNQLVVANLDGAGEIAISDTSAGYYNMAWSPDDRQIAVTRLDPSHDTQVWVMNADGSGARALTHFKDPDYGSPQWPAWSRDGKRIALQSNRNSKAPGFAWIWIVDVETGKATNITPHAGLRLDETPSWFPDGTRLAFQSDRSGRMEIWTMGADGSDPKQLTR